MTDETVRRHPWIAMGLSWPLHRDNRAPWPHWASRAGFWQDILTCFRSVHLAIVLLSLLALGTLLGVVFPQEGTVELAQIQKQFGANFGFFQSLRLFNVFSSFWFITLQVLFFFNLLIGSFQWLKPATLAAVQKTCFSPEALQRKPEVFSLPVTWHGSLAVLQQEASQVLKRHGYRVYSDQPGRMYAHKGSMSRLGPSIAHLGILMCLLAGLYACLTGFKALKMAVPGETFAVAQADSLKTNMPRSVWLGTIPDWRVAVKDFHVTFYPDHPETAQQYYSTLEIRSPQGRVLKRQTISVNHPLVYDDVSIYQASYAPTGRFWLTVNDRPMAVTVNSRFNDRPIAMATLPDQSTLILFPFFAQQDPGVKDNFGVFFVRHPKEKLTPGVMPANLRLREGESGVLKGYRLTYRHPEMSTGLQLKRAPEVPWMYAAYLVIAAGTVLCFFSQRQIWLAFQPVSSGRYALLVCPKTNKARLSFRKDLLALSDDLMRLPQDQKG